MNVSSSVVALAGKRNGARTSVREPLNTRARELALRAGHVPPPVSQLDYEQAKREVTGESEIGRQEAVLDSPLAPIPVVQPGPQLAAAWTDRELDDSILKLCDEFPGARMAACSRALELCRRSTPRGTPESLLTAMRESLREEIALEAAALTA